MKNIIRLLIAFSVVLVGLAMVPVIGLPTTGYRWQTYADAYLPVTLEVNYTSGQPGSFFTFMGSNYPPNYTVTILVNDTVLGDVTTDGNGDIIFLIDSSGADIGHYFVTTDEPDSSTAEFWLGQNVPLRPQEGDGTVFSLPAGIAYTIWYLPVTVR